MYDVFIIGCGVTGAACAYTLAKYDLSIGIAEAGSDVAAVTTKANSAIIHAGYDPKPGTLMARLNVRGAEMAPELCRKLDVPFKQCGSLVLAFNDADLTHLEVLKARGEANGVPGLEILSAAQVRAREPKLADNVCGALWAPTSAIINPWEYALAMAETAVRNGAELHRCCRVTGIAKQADGTFSIQTTQGEFSARYVLSAAGVHAAEVRSLLEPANYEIVPTRGQYYLLDKSEGDMVGCTIFQCPDERGKGVLVSPTVHGNLIVGPDAIVGDADDVRTDSAGLQAIAAAAKRSVPTVDLRRNIRNFAGVRANGKTDEFIIEESRAYPGFIDLAAIKSPGLSAAPAIAEYVAEMLRGAGLVLREKENYIDSRVRIRVHELDATARSELVARESAYGRVICRCEDITEGEIVAALRGPIPPTGINAVKRRVGSGMGRCQGGFCTPKVHELIVRELGLDWTAVTLENEGSELLAYETKTEVPV